MAKTLTIRIEDELHKEFKRYALENDTDMTTILIEYIKKIVNESKEK